MKRHKTETVRRLASHPTFPLCNFFQCFIYFFFFGSCLLMNNLFLLYSPDLSGGQDGCVQLWEWTHQQPISTPRPAGTYAKVTHVGFSQPGSKFGVTDSDGTLSLWQTTNTSANPFWVCCIMECYHWKIQILNKFFFRVFNVTIRLPVILHFYHHHHC